MVSGVADMLRAHPVLVLAYEEGPLAAEVAVGLRGLMGLEHGDLAIPISGLVSIFIVCVPYVTHAHDRSPVWMSIT